MNLEIKEIQDLAEKLQDKVRRLIIVNENLDERFILLINKIDKIIVDYANDDHRIVTEIMDLIGFIKEVLND